MRGGGDLLPFDGPGTNLRQGSLLLGRLPGRTPALTLESMQVDAEHALIYLGADGAWHIKDLGSQRGTWIFPGPYRVEDEVLSGTRVVVLGDTALRVTVSPDG